jgi:hypothetical protein
MASVRMSQELRNIIENQGAALFVESINKAQKKLADDFPDRLMDDIYANEYEKYVVHLNALPAAWLMTVNGCYIQVKGTVDAIDYAYSVHAESTTKDYLLPKVDGLKESYGGNKYYKDGHRPSQPIFDELHKYHSRIKKIQDERDKFVTTLKKTLSRCNTLKQFIDVWPHAEELIPESYLRKLNEVVVRNKQERIDPKVSTEISSILVKRSILNSRE